MTKRKVVREPWFVFIMLFGIYYFVVYLVDSQTNCVYKNLFGIPCPGCGMTRSYVHLLQGDFSGAFNDHPLFFTVPVIGVMILLIFSNKISQKTKKILNYCLVGFTFLFIVTYIVRMLSLFPDHDPLKFYEQGLFPSVYRLIKSIIIHWVK